VNLRLGQGNGKFFDFLFDFYVVLLISELSCPAHEISFQLPLIMGTSWGQAFLSTSTADKQPAEQTRVRLIFMVPPPLEFYLNVGVRYKTF